MPPSLGNLGRRLGALGLGFVKAILRDNKVVPPVFALLALVVFAWVVAGTFVGGPDEEQVSNQTNLAQSQNFPAEDPVDPEAETRDVDSYAAYRNKDPFRQLLASAESTSGQSSDATTQAPGEDTSGTTDSNGSGSLTGNSPRPTDGGGDRAQDTDNDGLTDRREAALAQDPQNPDTDADGVPDGADDSDGDGQPDGRTFVAGNSAGSDADSGADDGSSSADASAPSSNDAGGRRGGRAGDGRPGRDDDLLDSGGSLYAP